jgi:large subunit ribosomal protein L17
MRHRKKINHLGRKSQHRNALLSNMAASLILNKRIFTTLAKAKALKVYVEPLITKSKEDSTHSRRTVFSYLQNKNAVSELFREVAQKIADRPGGYTRILKTGFRKGDAAEMCFIELVDYNPNMLKSTDDTSKRTRRSRRGKKSSDSESTKQSPEAASADVAKEVEVASDDKETTKDVQTIESSAENVAKDADQSSVAPEADNQSEEEEEKK